MAKSSFEQRGGRYRQVGDYLIPNLTLPPEEAKIHIGRWCQLHKDYLIKHNQALLACIWFYDIWKQKIGHEVSEYRG